MKHDQLQLIAMAFFVTGFVLAGSGWSLVLTRAMEDRPEWSLCGLELCMCTPTTAAEPLCPLCEVAGDAATEECTDEPPTNNGRRSMPKGPRYEAAMAASQSGCASIFLSFVFGSKADAHLSVRPNAHQLIVQDDRPMNPTRDLPTPPPRA